MRRANAELGAEMAPVFAGLDIGGSKVAAALVDGDGAELAFAACPWLAAGGTRALRRTADSLLERLTRSLAEEGLEVAGAGIAVPELVDLDGRVASEDVIPGLASYDLTELTTRWAGAGRTVIESDVRAAALAESRLGAGRGRDSFAYVSVGTGISSCLVQRGIPWPGAHGGAILLGSGTIGQLDGTPGLLEQIASGPAILEHYRDLGGALGTVPELLAAYATDAAARAAVSRAGRALGLGLAIVINLLDPEAVVVGGGLGSVPGPLWDQTLQSVEKHVYWEAARATPLIQAELGPRSGAVGAALSSCVMHVG